MVLGNGYKSLHGWYAPNLNGKPDFIDVSGKPATRPQH